MNNDVVSIHTNLDTRVFSWCGEGSGKSEVGGIVIVLISLLVKGLMVVIGAFSKTFVLSVKGLTTTVDFFRVQCV